MLSTQISHCSLLINLYMLLTMCVYSQTVYACSHREDEMLEECEDAKAGRSCKITRIPLELSTQCVKRGSEHHSNSGDCNETPEDASKCSVVDANDAVSENMHPGTRWTAHKETSRIIDSRPLAMFCVDRRRGARRRD